MQRVQQFALHLFYVTSVNRHPFGNWKFGKITSLENGRVSGFQSDFGATSMDLPPPSASHANSTDWILTLL
jgi:hypothetical protein